MGSEGPRRAAVWLDAGVGRRGERGAGVVSGGRAARGWGARRRRGQPGLREVVGNPAGKAAVVLHGGPGSGCSTWWPQLRYNCSRWRDQPTPARAGAQATQSSGKSGSSRNTVTGSASPESPVAIQYGSPPDRLVRVHGVGGVERPTPSMASRKSSSPITGRHSFNAYCVAVSWRPRGTEGRSPITDFTAQDTTPRASQARRLEA